MSHPGTSIYSFNNHTIRNKIENIKNQSLKSMELRGKETIGKGNKLSKSNVLTY